MGIFVQFWSSLLYILSRIHSITNETLLGMKGCDREDDSQYWGFDGDRGTLFNPSNSDSCLTAKSDGRASLGHCKDSSAKWLQFY